MRPRRTPPAMTFPMLTPQIDLPIVRTLAIRVVTLP
jgi:hypothetical protein